MFFKLFQNSIVGHYKVLGDTLREKPELLYSEYSQATENVLKKQAANVEVGFIHCNTPLSTIRACLNLALNRKSTYIIDFDGHFLSYRI